ncbi:MAG: PAS domain S-box protein [Flavobacteriales bacterium]|nr:PAS domain S-box protein [Flavobacteriales bacterium]
MNTKLTALFQHASDPIVVVDATSRNVVYLNNPAESFLHGCARELIGKNMGEIFPKVPMDEVFSKVKDLYLYADDSYFFGVQTTFQLFKYQGKEVVQITFRHDFNNPYQLLFSKNVAGIYKIDVEGIIINCNPAFAHILGYNDPEELIGTHVTGVYSDPADRKKFLKDLQKGTSLSNYEILLKRKDGKRVWCLENAFLDNTGLSHTINGTLIDISAVKRAKLKFEQLFNKSTDAILLIEDGKIVDCNPQFEIIFNNTKEHVLDQCPYLNKGCLIDPEFNDIDLFKHKMERALQGESQRMSLVCLRGDQSTFHAQWDLSSFNLDDHQYIQAIIRDVTDHVVYEEAIRASEERFKKLSDVAIESVVYVRDGMIVDSNDQFSKLLGYKTRREITGKRIEEFFNSNDLDRVRKSQEIGSKAKFEVHARDRFDSLLFLEAAGGTIMLEEQEAEVYLFYNITSRKRAEIALEQSNDRYKNLVENSPNGIFILTDFRVRYTNASGIDLLGFQDEDELYDQDFFRFIHPAAHEDVRRILNRIREGEDVDYTETKICLANGNQLDVGLKANLTVYENRPSLQVTLNNLSTRVMLIQEQVRAQIAEEINELLKREIEEHKLTQQKLIAAENFTRNIIESSIDMIIAVDDKSRITEINAAALHQFGYSANRALGMDARKLYAGNDQFRAVMKSLEDEGVFSGEITNITKGGEEFVSLLSASLIRNEKGEVLGSMGVSRDITEIKKAELELRASEERYRDIFENASDFILSIDGKGKFIYANNAFKDSLGYDDEELAALSIYDLADAGILNKKKKLFSTFVGEDLRILFEARDGSIFIAEGSASVRYQDGKPHSIRAILRDVTQARQKEREALEQKAKLESIFNSTRNVMMWTLDRKFQVTTCNKNFVSHMSEVHGMEVGPGTPFLKQIKKKVNKNLYQNQLESFETAFEGKPQEFELPLIDKNGHALWLQVFLNPVMLDGNLEEISCLTYDITDRIEIDRKIRDSLKEKEVLLQEVHHRVKNNLQVISSILNLQSSYVTDEGTLEILSESQNRIKSMSYIHESLYQTADFSAVDFPDYLNTLVRNLVHSYNLHSGAVEVIAEYADVHLSLDQSIPCGLIVNELVSNAMKYAYADVSTPKLWVKLSQEGKNVQIKVADNGVGLPADFKYQESDSLGIQLVYTLVEQLDATIDVNSESGTCFLITFEVP